MLTETKRKYLKKSPPWESDSSKCEPSHDSGIVNADRGGAYFMTYIEQIKSPKWQKRRLEILERDHFACILCKDKDSELHVHHIVYDKNKMIWEYNGGLLVTLCSNCHENIHAMYRDINILIFFTYEKFGFDAAENLISFLKNINSK